METISKTLVGELEATHRRVTGDFLGHQCLVETLDTKLPYQLAKSRNGSEHNHLPVQVLNHLDPDESKLLPRLANPEN